MRSHRKKPLQSKTTVLLLPSVSNGIGRVARGALVHSNTSVWSATGTTRPRNAPTWLNHSATPHISNRAGVSFPVMTRAVPFVTEGAKCFTEAHTNSGDPVPQSAFNLHMNDSHDSLIIKSSDSLSPSRGSEVHYIHTQL